MNSLSSELNSKELFQRFEDTVDELIYEESFYDDAVSTWLDTMPSW